MGGLHGTAIIDRIAEHLRRGELLDLAPDLALGSRVDEVVMTSWDGTHSIAERGAHRRPTRLFRCSGDKPVGSAASVVPGWVDLPTPGPLDPPGTGTAGWLDLLRTATPAYAAQPYQQLASVHRAAGHDRDVREILIAQRQAQLDRGVLTGRERLWAKITGITLGYGYQPWRALLFLLSVVVTLVALAVTLGAHGALVHPQDPKNPATATSPCTVTEQVEVGLAVGAPFFDTRVRDRCTTTNTATGIGLSYSIWGLQLLTGAFAALFIAGFTGIVRKT